jgi:hypothetical protein
MEKITFDAGLKSYRINGGAVLKFNPADPNLYARFMEAVERVKQLENTLLQPEADPLEQMCRMDKQVKETLGWVFGGDNDFDKLLGGVNLLAVASNGQRVITNLLEALLPVLTEGAQLCAGQQVQLAKAKANARREAQC